MNAQQWIAAHPLACGHTAEDKPCVKCCDTITICPYCGSEIRGDRLGCCGESSAHFEKHWYDHSAEQFVIIATGELTEECGDNTRVDR